MISVIIRNRNQDKALEFLLSNLINRYANDIDEIIVVDNLSTDDSEKITLKYGARFETIKKFSYGGSANVGVSIARNNFIVIFSAHSYPVSPDFFKVIKHKFNSNLNLAGLRCLHSNNDYKNYILDINANSDPNKSGLIFSGSAFRKNVWMEIPFNEKVPTFEDKDWTKKVLKAGYEIEFAPVVFNYEIKRTKAQEYFRFTRDVLGNYQVWHKEDSIKSILIGVVFNFINVFKTFFLDIFYIIKKFFFMIKFKIKKPNKFQY